MDDLAATWIEYKATGDMDVRNELAEHYHHLVRIVASKLAIGLPNMVERDDLISYGTFGLFDAIKKFDLDKGVKFETYAVTRIKGAILDELRALDWVPRTIRSKARDVEKATTELSMALGRLPEDAELAEYLGVSLQDLWEVASQRAMSHIATISSDDDDSDYQRLGVGDLAFDPKGNPEDLHMIHDLGNILAGVIEHLDERDKQVLTLYYCQEMTLSEISRVLGVTVSRVCQIQSKILQQLREELGHGVAQMVA